jgi:hypothetical protein
MKNTARTIAAALCVALLLMAGGCATNTLDNVPACEVAAANRKGYVNSMFGPVGLTFKVTDRSAQVMCPDEPVKDKNP